MLWGSAPVMIAPCANAFFIIDLVRSPTRRAGFA